MKTYRLFWSPTGQHIATVQARTPRAAVRKAPLPYRKYLGEIYTDHVDTDYPPVLDEIANAQEAS
jgi:hypothetical protein